MLTQAQVKDRLHYDPVTGIFTHNNLPKLSRHIRPGEVAGAKNSTGGGYLQVRIKCQYYSLHRLAWIYMTGSWPKAQIDHINGNPSDNRFENLRECSPLENSRNRGMASHNTSGYKGVSFCKVAIKNPWRANMKIDGKLKHLGCFRNPEEAYFEYCINVIEHHKEFANFG